MRWVQLLIGILFMAMIANLQYGWTLFVNPIANRFQWSKTSIQFCFTLFVIFQTWPVPIWGWIVDRYGPGIITMLSSILVAMGWIINSVSVTIGMFYVGSIIGGLGAGAIYCTCIGNALKWFPDRRGLAVGLTAMGYGAGAALTTIPIAGLIKAGGYQSAFLTFGMGQGLVVFLFAWMLRTPRNNELAALPKPAVAAEDRAQYNMKGMVRTSTFWVMYLIFVMMATGALIGASQIGLIGAEFLKDQKVTIFGYTTLAVPFALSFNLVANGTTRPFFGWVSDVIGRENAMFIAFSIEGIAAICLFVFRHEPVLFVIFSVLVFFCSGEIYSLFPSTCADTYGSRYAAGNAGLLYTAKGTASLLLPVTNMIIDAGHGWGPVFVLWAILSLSAAGVAMFVLKPMRRRLLDEMSSA